MGCTYTQGYWGNKPGVVWPDPYSRDAVFFLSGQTWQATVYNGTAVVDDDQESDFPLTLNAGEGKWTWPETQNHTCSTERSAYGETGSYGDTLYNSATVTGSDGQTDSANADTTYSCSCF